MSFEKHLLSLVRLCGYLLIKSDVLHTHSWCTYCLWTKFKRGKVFRPSPTNSTGTDFSQPASTFHKVLTIHVFIGC